MARLFSSTRAVQIASVLFVVLSVMPVQASYAQSQPTSYSAVDRYRLARQVGFSPDEAVDEVAYSLLVDPTGDPTYAYGPFSEPYGDNQYAVGLFAIPTVWANKEVLTDPVLNASMELAIRRDFGPAIGQWKYCLPSSKDCVPWQVTPAWKQVEAQAQAARQEVEP